MDSILARSPAQPLFLRRAERRLAVLAYHGVDDPAGFERHLDHLARCAHPIGLADLWRSLEGGPRLPRGAVLVTFDDGERSVLEAAMPLLAARGIPAVVFVAPGHLDTQTPLWTAEARALARQGGVAPGLVGLAPDGVVRALKAMPDSQRLAGLDALRGSAAAPAAAVRQLAGHELPALESGGIAVGNHTMTHACLPQCPPEKVEAEIRLAHERLAELLGHAPEAFAYPNGDADPRGERVLAELGCRGAFLFDHRLAALPPASRYRISRLRVNSDTSMDRFRIILSGLHPALHHAVGRP